MKKFFKGIKPSTYLHLGLLAMLFLFLVLPLIIMLCKANGNDYQYIFTHEKLPGAILNSFLYSLIGAIISVVLATIVAYLLNRSSIKGKKWYILALTLSMLIPTLSIGLGIRNLFGEGGLLDLLFKIKYDGAGLPNLIVGSVVFTFPVAFLLVYDSLLYEDKTMYDAANTLGISRFRSFFGITLPFLKTTLISAFFASFTLIFADYGLPMEVAGKVDTLPVMLIQEFNGNPLSGRSAVISLFLLMPAIAAFFVDIFNKEQSSGVASKSIIGPTKAFNIVTICVSVFVAFILFVPQLVFLMISFVKRFPSDMTFTFDNYKNAFSPYASVSATTFLANSLVISLLAGLLGTALAYFTGYMAVRTQGKLKKIVHLLSISTLAVPGLVLGLGFVYLFKDTKGWFADTIFILVIVNIIHYFSSPYLMAKNAFEKINKDYETVGDTLGISHTSLFFKVMIPNSISTIVQMFSYLFINSMITISAVSLLCSPDTTPLSVSINTYENQRQYENQAVVSAIILLVNIVAKIGFDQLNSFLKKLNKKERMEKDMSLTRFQFNVLTYIEEHQGKPLTQRQIADGVTLSLGTTNKILNQFIEDDAVVINADKEITVTELGYKLLEPYKVRKAIVIAAGFGSRMAPVTLDTPKPLVKVNGVRIIDTLLDALYAKDITNITIVVGYKKEQFQQLLEKYPTLKFIENPIYNESNNISSVYAARDIIDRCYICEADLVISNPKVITKYQYTSNYLGAYVTETDDWCFFKKGNYIDRVSVGGENCWHMIGVSYWNEEDSKKLREDIIKVFNSRGGKEKYWDNVPLTICKKDFKIEVRDCKKKYVTEIDNYSELVIIDSSYKDYKVHNPNENATIYQLRDNDLNTSKCLFFLNDNIIFSGYIIPNIEKYGFSNSFFETFYSLDINNEIVLFATRYYNSMQIICKSFTESLINSIVELVNRYNIKRISGTEKIVFELYKKINKGRFKKGRAVLLSNEPSEYRYGKMEWKSATTKKEFCELAKLVCEDPDFKVNYSEQTLSELYYDRYKNGNGRNYYIEINGNIVSHAATYAECRTLAVISGVKTKKGFEKKGLGTSLVVALKNELLKEGKKIVLYFYEDNLLKFYETFGYDIVKEWAKLELFN